MNNLVAPASTVANHAAPTASEVSSWDRIRWVIFGAVALSAMTLAFSGTATPTVELLLVWLLMLLAI